MEEPNPDAEQSTGPPPGGQEVRVSPGRTRPVAIALIVVLLVAALAGVGLAIRGGSLLPSFGFGSQKAPLSTAQLAAMVQPSIVTVTVKVFRGGTAEGSGFFYGKPGHVLTNARVITRAIAIEVTASGRTWSADVIGIDRSRDLAELKVAALRAKPIQPAKVLPRVGANVFVMGHPIGALPNNVTRGSVGGLGQDLTAGSRTFHNLIQTDAVVNPGTTGGPIVNRAGELLGMVTLGEAGYAFGIPVADVDTLARDWTSKEASIQLGPPPVAGPASALMISSGLPSGFTLTKSEVWNGTGFHVVYEKAEDYDYGGEVISIYVDVTGGQDAGQRAYEGRLDALATYGFSSVGSSSDLGDVMTWFQSLSKDQTAYAVLWRDRNAWALLYLTSGTPSRPEVSVATALDLAGREESLLSDGLASYE